MDPKILIYSNKDPVRHYALLSSHNILIYEYIIPKYLLIYSHTFVLISYFFFVVALTYGPIRIFRGSLNLLVFASVLFLLLAISCRKTDSEKKPALTCNDQMTTNSVFFFFFSSISTNAVYSHGTKTSFCNHNQHHQ